MTMKTKTKPSVPAIQLEPPPPNMSAGCGIAILVIIVALFALFHLPHRFLPWFLAFALGYWWCWFRHPRATASITGAMVIGFIDGLTGTRRYYRRW